LQKIKTVEVEASAEREKRQVVIAAEAAAEQQFVSTQRAADAKAYQVQKDAEARKAAADAGAEAVTKKANADAAASKARAEGDHALALVPVEIEREKVKIEQDRINNVIKPELEARERSGKVAQEFEVSKLRIEAEKQTRIETAKAMATIGQKISMQLYGTPENAAGMLKALMSGQQVAEVINSFTENVDEKVLERITTAVDGVGKFLSSEKKEEINSTLTK
jgi:nucleoside diphosphate kinase